MSNLLINRMQSKINSSDNAMHIQTAIADDIKTRAGNEKTSVNHSVGQDMSHRKDDDKQTIRDGIVQELGISGIKYIAGYDVTTIKR